MLLSHLLLHGSGRIGLQPINRVKSKRVEIQRNSSFLSMFPSCTPLVFQSFVVCGKTGDRAFVGMNEMNSLQKHKTPLCFLFLAIWNGRNRKIREARKRSNFLTFLSIVFCSIASMIVL